MGEDEHEKGDGYPSPSALDEEDVEEVILAREIRGDEGRVLDVRVAEDVVRSGAGFGGEEGEEGAEEEEEGVGCEEDEFGGSREVMLCEVNPVIPLSLTSISRLLRPRHRPRPHNPHRRPIPHRHTLPLLLVSHRLRPSRHTRPRHHIRRHRLEHIHQNPRIIRLEGMTKSNLNETRIRTSKSTRTSCNTKPRSTTTETTTTSDVCLEINSTIIHNAAGLRGQNDNQKAVITAVSASTV